MEGELLPLAGLPISGSEEEEVAAVVPAEHARQRPQHSGGGRPDLTAPGCAFQTPSHVNTSPWALILRCTVLPGALNRLHRKLPSVPGTDWL